VVLSLGRNLRGLAEALPITVLDSSSLLPLN
jgi:hypothetical protein